MNKPDSYTEQLKALHESTNAFGAGNVTKKHYSFLEGIAKNNKINSILDYGCGKGHFVEYIQQKHPDINISGFDVANEQYLTKPTNTFDLIVCLDVLEHVEFGNLQNVLADIKVLTGKLFICSIANYPAAKKLPDGRNAHVTQLGFAQWMMHLSLYFRVDRFYRTGTREGLFVCSPLADTNDWR